MASIQRRDRAGSTVYCVRIRRAGYPLVSRTFPTLAEAERYAGSIEADLDGRGMPESATLADLLDCYAPHAPKSYGGECLRYWRQALGSLRVTAVTPNHIRAHRDRLAALPAQSHGHKTSKPRSPTTTRKYLVALGAAFRYAERELGWSIINPVRVVKLPTPATHRVRWLTDAERSALLAAAQESRSPALHPAVALSLSTGLRLGELHALRWPDVDLDAGSAILRQTENGDARCLPLTPSVCELLRALPRDERDDRVFPRLLVKAWRSAVQRARLHGLRWHDMRHDAGTRLTAAGTSTRVVMAILGHRQPRMALVYEHVSDPTAREALLKVMT
jgi:integrase